MIIDKPKAIELLERAFAEKGADYVDPKSQVDSCTYAEDNRPGCIIGHVLFYVGATVEQLARFDQADAGNNVDSTTVVNLYDARLLDEFGVTPDAVDVFAEAQSAQDQGLTWGRALAKAREV